jgi:soluble lytic murein transglycosylase
MARRLGFVLSVVFLLSCHQVGLCKAKPNRHQAHQSAQKNHSDHKDHSEKTQSSGGVPASQLERLTHHLFENPSPASSAAVERFAHAHAGTSEARLAWLSLGYERYTDHDYNRAASALEKALQNPGPLSDYVQVLLAKSYAGTNNSRSVVETLANFSERYSDSLLSSEAAILLAKAQIAEGNPKQAIALLEHRRDPLNPEVELTLARAYVASSDFVAAKEILRRLYYEMPTVADSEQAGKLLSTLPSGSGPEPSFDDRLGRAEKFAQAGRFKEAANEYALLRYSPGNQSSAAQVALASVLHRLDRDSEALSLLNGLSGLTGDLRARQLAALIEISSSHNDETLTNDLLSTLRKEVPDSEWLNRALQSAAAMSVRLGHYDRALDLYRESGPSQNKEVAYGHWRATWAKAQHDLKGAKKDLEDHVKLYPESSEVPAALYWLGRIAQQQSDYAGATGYYRLIQSQFPNYYYAELSDRQLKTLGSANAPSYVSLKEIIPASKYVSPSTSRALVSETQLGKARLLQQIGLTTFAVHELQNVLAANGPVEPVVIELVRCLHAAGRYGQAIEIMKTIVPNYSRVSFSSLPRPYWDALFPRPYWNDLVYISRSNGLDPFLVAALIRQESEFEATAVSRAQAVGLMQVLPSSGKQLARTTNFRFTSPKQLLAPATNLRLGTLMFRRLLDRYDGHVEYALAAYNAGDGRVEEWRSNLTFGDMPTFVESIPFTETRDYVQAVIRNASIYRRLYEVP